METGQREARCASILRSRTVFSAYRTLAAPSPPSLSEARPATSQQQRRRGSGLRRWLWCGGREEGKGARHQLVLSLAHA